MERSVPRAAQGDNRQRAARQAGEEREGGVRRVEGSCRVDEAQPDPGEGGSGR